MLNGQERGFYVEVGADDGEGYSNSLFFERFRAWSGVLIEPNQESFAKMKQLNRRALLLNTCVSPSNLSEPLTFVANPFEGHNTNFLGGISSFLEITQDATLQAKYEKHFAGGDLYTPVVQTLRCSPLVDLLPDFVTTVDYLSLDTEGSELGILSNIPFDDIEIKIISVDVSVSITCDLISLIFTFSLLLVSEKAMILTSLWPQRAISESNNYYMMISTNDNERVNVF